MADWNPFSAPRGANRSIALLGWLFVVLAAGRAYLRLDQGATVSDILVITLLIAAPGFVLAAASYWLSRVDVDEQFYPDVLRWCLAGFGLMAGVLVLYHLQPDASITSPTTAPPILLALSTLAGFAVGLHDGRAKTRTHELEQRNNDLERTQAELEETVAELEASNERLERYRRYTDDVLDAISDIFYVCTADGTLRRWNRSLNEVTGYSDAEIASMSVPELIGGPDRETVESTIDAGFERGRVQVETKLLTSGGDRIPYEFTASRLETPDGEPVLAGIGRDVSDRNARERALEESEQRYRTLAENFPNGAVALIDDELRHTLVEGQGFEKLDFDADELRGKRIGEVYPSPIEDELESQFRTSLEGEATAFELELQDRTFEFRTIPLTDDEGDVFAVLAMSQDVTERKIRERALERTERRFEAIFNDPNILVGLLEPDGTVLDINQTAMEYVDADLADVVGEPFWETPWWNAADGSESGECAGVATDVERWTKRAATGEYVDFEADLTRPDGEEYTLSGYFRPVTDEHGDVVSLIVSDRDVTERKERERELERRAHQQQIVADLGQFALETDDLDELIDEACRKVADVLDTEYCKVLDLDDDGETLLLRQGVGWRDGIVGEATISAIEADSQAAYTLANDQPIVVEDLSSETRFGGPDLLRNHGVRSGISTVIGPFDEPWGILGTHDTAPREYTDEDVTFVQSVSNVLAEAIERHQYRADLEELVADLEESNTRLEESNRRLEQFAYAASHDLQEPLRMVSSYLRLIERRYGDALDEDGEEFLEFAVDGADRMREMIEGLLQYSRVETQGEAFEPVDLEDVLDDARDDLRMRIDETDAEITADSLPRVRGDSDQLRQVFQNLLANAIRYSGEGPPRVHVSAERNGSTWTVSVADEGIGIDPGDQDLIFEVFEGLPVDGEYAGTGIGLAVCERIVERHGGEIWVDSEPDEGATFSFTLSAVSDEPGTGD
ncbi:PAS domain-containing protein [Natronolimnohabitans innermongolicus]|uniref:histidine kinase n=1 Tax=Natronolimnohabitans innermongolicus JCM 12255 TaxID=1227499 RepID=L9WNV8_9EURY|nr:PAS domain-containing protein [Natronolimnohabitans innermongolicus]ELY51149.1 multi-sensor signal transduction histidine kinase [Natronolimnohabitans innermongolicus JCM 12255]